MKTAGRWRFHLFLISLVVAVPLGAAHASRIHGVIWERRDLYRLVDQRALHDAVVFVSTPTGTSGRMDPDQLTRNGVGDEGAVLYLLNPVGDDARVFAAYPHRTFYRYRYDVRGRRGTLDAVSSPR